MVSKEMLEAELKRLKARVKILEAENGKLRQELQALSRGASKSDVSRTKSTELQKLLKHLPQNADDWVDRAKQIGVFHTKDALGILCSLVCSSSSVPDNPITTGSKSPTPEAILERTRLWISSLREQRVRMTQFCNFAELIFFCLCRVAREGGTTVDIVDRAANDFLAKTTIRSQTVQAGHLRHLRAGVLWPTSQWRSLRETSSKQHRYLVDMFLLLC